MRGEDLQNWGWRDATYEPAPHAELGRVLREDRRRLSVITSRGARRAAHRGKAFVKDIAVPQVGDWVSVTRDEDVDALAQIIETLPRKSEIARLTKNGAQTIAANVDEAWLLVDASREPNTAALERYLIAIEESGAHAALLLSKIDLSTAWRSLAGELQGALGEVDIHAVSALEGMGIDVLARSLRQSATYCLMGESGSGKSTLVNRVAGAEVARTGEVRASDGKGRHVTTHRELFRCQGAIFVDTPGMRELVPALPPGARPKRFEPIYRIAEGCRFPDCRHADEPGCAVKQAVREGTLSASLVENYSRLSLPPDDSTNDLMRSQRSSSTT